MCSIPPPPPPPLSISDGNSYKKLQNINLNNPTNIASDDCLWASNYPELREACVRHDICTDKAPFKYKYNYFESIAQVGPTCGLVALSMLVNGEISALEMLNISRIENHTCNGEMFSCKNMLKLSEEVFNLTKLHNISCSLINGRLYCTEIIKKLLNGAVLLVPYDADCNHSPCQRKGHTAHWALVCGIIIIDDPGEDTEYDPRNVLVLCKHGKSKYLAVWNLLDLDKSNKNLMEFSPKKVSDGLTYVLPEGGIGGEDGLRDQYLIYEFLKPHTNMT